MSERFDAVIIGAGIAGETCARRLGSSGFRVAVVERDRVGGECAFWARVPSSTLLGPANEVWRTQQVAGASSPSLGRAPVPTDGARPLSQRDEHLEVKAIERAGITLLRGEARMVRLGQIQVGDRMLQTEKCVIATGSAPRITDIPGLAEVGYWTNREALRFQVVPQQVLVLGSEGQAVEMAQMFRLYGAEVTLVALDADRLLHHEDPEVGRLLLRHLQRSGIRVVLGQTVSQITAENAAGCVASLSDGSSVYAQAVIVAAGRTARTELCSDGALGVHLGENGIRIDECCRAAEGIWAVGDVTGLLPLSHLAQYQANVAADDMLGHPHPAQYLSVPRVYFTEPQVAATGLTLNTARAKDVKVVSVSVDLKTPVVYVPAEVRAAQPEGKLTLHANSRTRELVGAWAVAPDAGEWIHLAVLGLSVGARLEALYDTMEKFPRFSEPYRVALEALRRKL
jgi:dihydrolipoamide dehydrogenase